MKVATAPQRKISKVNSYSDKCYTTTYISSRGPKMWLKRPQKRGAEMKKSPPNVVGPKFEIPHRWSGGRRLQDHQETLDLQNHAPRKGLQRPGPQLHALGPHNYGRHGPTVLASRFQTKIYKRLAATEKANHQPIYRNSATALDQLSIYPAAAQRSSTERDGTTPAKTSRGAAEATANAAAPAPRHDTHRPPRHTATLQRHNHRAAPDTTATRPPYAKNRPQNPKKRPPPPPPPDTTHIDRRDTQRHNHRAAPDTTATRPPYAKKQKRDHKEPQRKRKNSEAAPTQRACRGGTAPPQAVPTTRRNHTTDCAPPQAAHGHARRRGATPGGADAAQHSKSRIWRPLAAASVYGSRATHWGPRVSWGPTCGPSHIDPLQVDAISEVSRPAFTPWAGL